MKFKGAWWAWALQESVSVICWTALAVYFGKWWIALFVLVTTSSLRVRNDGGDIENT